MKGQASKAAKLMKALSNRHRLLILCELHRNECSVGTLEKAVGLKQSPLSQHLAKLRADGLVKTRREGVSIFYSLADPKVAQVIATLYGLYCPPSGQGGARKQRV